MILMTRPGQNGGLNNHFLKHLRRHFVLSFTVFQIGAQDAVNVEHFFRCVYIFTDRRKGAPVKHNHHISGTV